MGMRRVNFTVTTVSTELMFSCSLQMVAKTSPPSSCQEDNVGFAHIAHKEIYSKCDILVVKNLYNLFKVVQQR